MQNDYLYPEQNQLRHLRRWLLLSAFFIVLLVLASWVNTHGYLEVSVTGASNAATKYQLVEQGSGQQTNLSMTSGPFRKLVHKGSYEVTATAADKSYFEIVHVGGFLGTTTTNGSLSTERSRTFVGNNPSACMLYTGQVLVSFSCGSSLNNMQIHRPATSSSPTTTAPLSSDASTLAIDAVHTSGGDILFEHQNSGTGPYKAVYIRADGGLQDARLLGELGPSLSYRFSAFRGGFLATDSNFTTLLYFPNLNAAPVRLHQIGEDQTFIPFASSVSGDSVAIAYTNHADSPTEEEDNTRPVQTKVVIDSATQARSFIFDKSYGSVTLCGANRLCLLANGTLEIYDISSTTPRLVATLSKVQAINSSASGLVVFRDKEVIQLDTLHLNGYYSYSLGDYQYCGYAPDSHGYLLCLTTPKNKKVTLLINTTSADTDSIDKKVAKLLKMPELNDVSVYGNYIYLSPNLGQVMYDPSSGSFNYDPATTRAVDATINTQIHALGIDTARYTVINPF